MAPTARKKQREAAPAPAPAPKPAAMASPAITDSEPPSHAVNNDENPLLPVPLLPRQQSGRIQTPTIPSYYGSLNSSPDPGAVAGITLGAVAGFVLLLWLVYTCVNLGNPNTDDTEGSASVVTRKSRRGARSSRSHHRHRQQREETVEIRRRGAGGPVIVEEVASARAPSEVEVEIVRERRSVSRAPPPPPQMRRVVSSETGDEDEVVVIEEHSPPRRHRSRVRSMERRSGGYREVDPDRFAGGDSSFVEVRRSGSHRR